MKEDRVFVHDMRNMLGIIIGYSKLLLDEMPAGDPQRLDVEEIHKAGENALVLIERWRSKQPGEETA